MDKIFLAIPSYLDEELYGTVFSCLSSAKNKDRIFLSIFSQDEDHAKLENIFTRFSFNNYKYEKINYLDAKGVGYARYITQKPLSLDYKYYFQVDSHTIFVNNWDSKIIEDYESFIPYWGDYIFTAYPPGYDYDENNFIDIKSPNSYTCLKIRKSKNETTKYESKYKTHSNSLQGDYHGFFCAGMAFGYTKHFLKVPYDPEIYFQGEEQTMSIRFYENDIKLVAPADVYCYHNYQGHKRIRHWEKNKDWTEYEKRSTERLHSFFQLKDLGIYGINNKDKYQQWIDCFVVNEET